MLDAKAVKGIARKGSFSTSFSDRDGVLVALRGKPRLKTVTATQLQPCPPAILLLEPKCTQEEQEMTVNIIEKTASNVKSV